MSGKNRSVDVEKIKEAVVAFGKKKGHVTVAELRELLPPDVIDHQDLGDWRKQLEAAGVKIVEEAIAVVESVGGSAEDELKKKPKAKSKSKRREGDESETARTNDPVRMYLRKMGSVSLLTREGEVEIAKRIEQGEMQVLDIVLRSPVAV